MSVSEETRRKMSDAAKRRHAEGRSSLKPWSEERRAKWYASRWANRATRGFKHTPEAVAKIKAWHTGRPMPRWAVQKTAETRLAQAPGRFWSLVAKSSNPDGCWEWQGALDRDGYGYFHYQRPTRAHRVSYRFNVGEIPAGHMVCHTCDNPKCVRRVRGRRCHRPPRPDHLYAGTPKQNTADMFRRSRDRHSRKRGAR